MVEENPAKKVFGDDKLQETDGIIKIQFTSEEDMDLLVHMDEWVKQKVKKQKGLDSEIRKEKLLREQAENKMEEYNIQAHKLQGANKTLTSELEKSINREKELKARLKDTGKTKKHIFCVKCGDNAKLKFCDLPFCHLECAKNVANAFKATNT